MKKLLASCAAFALFASFTVGCDVSSQVKLAQKNTTFKFKVKVRLKIINVSMLYLLTIKMETKKVTFASQKPNNEKMKENAFLRLYIKQKDEKKTDIPDTEVKSYEEVQKSDLPAKTKEKLGVK